MPPGAVRIAALRFARPAFAPYRSLIDALDLVCAQPAPGADCLDALNAQAIRLDTRNARGLPLRFFAPDGRLSARDYETHILQTGQVPTRAETWHDVLNALVWLRFPRFKAALNAAHGSAIAGETGPTRGRRRDALTVLNESSIWVISRDPAWPALLSERTKQPQNKNHQQTKETTKRKNKNKHALLE